MKNTLKPGGLIAAFAFCFSFFMPNQAFSTVTISPSGSVSACIGNVVTFTGSNTSGPNYSWSTAPTPVISGSQDDMAAYTFTVSGTYTITVSDGFTTASATVTVNANPTASAGVEPSSYATCATTVLGGNPTGSGGTPLVGPPYYDYLWSPGGSTIANPSVTGASGTYCVTVTDANSCTASSCVTVTPGPFIELLNGFGSFAGVIDGATDLETDYSDGTLYACGLGSSPNMSVQYDGINPLYGTSLAGTSGNSTFVWVAHYDPCSPYPLLWGEKIGTYMPDCASGQCVQPLSPNIAQVGSDIYVSFNIPGKAFISKISTSGGTPVYTTGLPGFVITDMKDDGSNEMWVTGYSTTNGNSFGGQVYSANDIFVGQLNASAGSLSWYWTYKTGLNISTNNIPSLAVMNLTNTSPWQTNSQSGLLLTTGDEMQFYDPTAGGSGYFAHYAGPIASGGGAINTRAVASPVSPNLYLTDGNKIYWMTYTYAYNTGTAPVAGSTPNVTATNPSIFDIRTDNSAGNVYSITTNQIEGYDHTLAPLSWSPPTPYNSCPSSGFSVPDQADRCLALDPNNGMPLYVGGTHPSGLSCAFEGTYSNVGSPMGFIARVDISSIAPGTFYKTNPNEPDYPATALADKKVFGVYPNPIQDELYIQTDAATEGYSYSLRTIEGKVVMSGGLTGSGALNTLSTSSLASGIYLIQVRSEGQVWTDKIVKE